VAWVGNKNTAGVLLWILGRAVEEDEYGREACLNTNAKLDEVSGDKNCQFFPLLEGKDGFYF